MSGEKSSKICRICLDSNIKKYMSLFEKYKEFSINDYILLITNVEIKKDDGFPDKICSNCFMELEVALKFKKKCEDSDILLRASKDKILEVCLKEDIKDIIIVKKEEPEEEEEVKFKEATNESIEDEYYAVEALEEMSVDRIKPFKSKAIDLKLECHDCGKLFKSKCKLQVHWKKTHMLSFLICDICKRRFKSYRAYHMHKKKGLLSCKVAGNNLVRVEGEGRSRVFHCNECEYKTFRAKDIQTHIVVHSGDKPFQCRLCQSRYTQQGPLQSHMENAHGQVLVEITCQYCGKQIRGRTKVYRHMKTHTNQKQECPICQKFISKSNIKIHMLRHGGTKTFTCEKCASTFYTIAELCNHKRVVHNKTNSFSCDLCSFTASRKERIQVHRKNHMTNNLPCTTCGMFFPTEKKLLLHQRRHVEEKKHECKLCDKKFFRRDSLNKHQRTKHNNMLPITKDESTPVVCKVEHVETFELDNEILKKPKIFD